MILLEVERLHCFTNDGIKNNDLLVIVEGASNDSNQLMKGIHYQKHLDQEGSNGMLLLYGLFPKFYSSIKENDSKILNNLRMLVDELKMNNSTKSKIESLKRYHELKDLLWMIYSPDVRFHLSSNSLDKIKTEPKIWHVSSLIDMLKLLSERKITGHDSISAVQNYINTLPEHADLIKNIIDKNLKARIGFNLLKSAFGEDCPMFEFSCALGFSAEKHLNYLKKSLERQEKWCISRKFDGIRVFVVYDSSNSTLNIYNRNKKLIKGLNPSVSEALKTDLREISGSFVIDGELVYIDSEGKEDFSTTVSIVKSLEPKDCKNLELHIFDNVSATEKGQTFIIRLEKLNAILAPILPASKMIRLVNQKVINSVSEFDYDGLKDEAIQNNYEGFIIRRDSDMKDGRSRDFLKIKPFQDAEFKVIDCEIGPMRAINELGQDVSEDLLLSITVEFEGNRVNVGSGFSISQRRDFARDPSQIVGKLVTVQYQSECAADGREGKSLRFPVFKYLHGDARSE